METIGSRLAALRGLSRLKATELGELAGLNSPAHVGLIERGGRPNVAATTAVELARVLGTTAEYLTTGRGTPPTENEVHAAVELARAAHRPRPVGADHTANDFTVTAPATPAVRPVGELRVERDSFSQVG